MGVEKKEGLLGHPALNSLCWEIPAELGCPNSLAPDLTMPKSISSPRWPCSLPTAAAACRQGWQEYGGAGGTQQNSRCIYQAHPKREAKAFIYGLADVQNVDHGEAPSGGRLARRLCSPRPSCTRAEAAAALQERSCCTKKHGVKPQRALA